ncbi:MAG TPA: helix-turn-helix domain-containing protein [Streptosporangiaceae bacterium]|jgi:hypothetical protein|nr:helix-turn-helix domain-containing protein [Streptosporangiaceae bacterium]
MTHPRNAPPDRATTAGADAEKAAFLRDLRALRDQAGLGPRDLAARAHFPEDTLVTAEAGPGLPSLPVLQAYVRGCGAGEAEWEDRWRRLNSDSASGHSDLPTRAPASNRPPARVMPFPEPGTEPDAIGFGLARVARGLAPLSSDAPQAPPEMGTRTPFGGGLAGNAGTDRSAQYSGSDNGSAGAGGWFDPAPRSAPPAPSDAPPAPPAVSPGAPTLQYPAAPEFAPPPEQSYQPPAPASYPAPSYRLPEEFRTPVPEPAEFRTPAPEPPAPSSSARPEAFGPPAGRGSGSAVPAAPGTPVAAAAASPKPHAAPARTSAWVVTAVILVLIIAALVWLVLGH